MTTPQADGVYPRVNASLLSKFPNMIVSVVGKYTGNGTLQCADGTVQLNLEQAVEVPMEDTVLEVIGQAMENGVVAMFIGRALSADTDLDIYNQMIQLQHSETHRWLFVGQQG